MQTTLDTLTAGDRRALLRDLHTEVYAETLRERDAVRAEKDRVIAQYDAKLARIEAYLHGLEAVMALESGEPPVEAPVPSPPRPNGHRPPIPGPGNRSARLPPRRPPFDNKTLKESAALILQTGIPMSVREIAEQLFVLRDRRDYEAATGSLTGQLSQGVKEGRWERRGMGVYCLRRGALDLAPLPVFEAGGEDTEAPDFPNG